MSPKTDDTAAATESAHEVATLLRPDQIPDAVSRHLRENDHLDNFGKNGNGDRAASLLRQVKLIRLEDITRSSQIPRLGYQQGMEFAEMTVSTSPAAMQQHGGESVFISDNSADTPLRQATPPTVMPHPQQLPMSSDDYNYGMNFNAAAATAVHPGSGGMMEVGGDGSGFHPRSQYSPPPPPPPPPHHAHHHHHHCPDSLNTTYLTDKTMVELNNLPPYEQVDGSADAANGYVIYEMYPPEANHCNLHNPLSPSAADGSEDILSQSMTIALGEQYSSDYVGNSVFAGPATAAAAGWGEANSSFHLAEAAGKLE
jgi:hypothetical protein